MSDKPNNPNSDDNPTHDATEDAVDKSVSSKPSSNNKPADGRSTGALRQSIDWDKAPDKQKPDEDSPKIPMEPSKEDEPPATASRRPDVLNSHEDFYSLNKKDEEPQPKTNPETAILPNSSPTWKKVIGGQAQGTTSTIGEQREVLFVIRGMIERVVMQDNGVVTIGRFDTGTVANEEIDLIPYGALDRGVSRRHCKIQLRDNQLLVTDLGSTNGTFLAGVRLKPDEPTTLRKGDELLLGRLAVQILFR